MTKRKIVYAKAIGAKDAYGPTLYSHDGHAFRVVAGTPFVDTEDDERYSRAYIEQKFGPLSVAPAEVP